MELPYSFGRYTLIRKLANGGMAEIFLARYSGAEGFSKLVAIKRILPETLKNTQFTSMLVDEAKALVHLQHQNVVQIYELAKENEHLFISMEYVNGIDLGRLLNGIIRGENQLPLKFTIFIVCQILEGLDFVHRVTGPHGKPLSIVHRDISPPNILCSWNGEVKVADFGIAKGNHRTYCTTTNQLKGKYSYMSPEQASSRTVDHRTDVFATGIILFELISGQRLFEASTDLKVVEKVRRSRIPLAKLSETPPQLQNICCTALSRDPNDRYQSAGEFLSALSRCTIACGYYTSAFEFGQYLRNLYPDEVQDLKEVIPAGACSITRGKTRAMTAASNFHWHTLKRGLITLLLLLLCFTIPAGASKQPVPPSDDKPAHSPPHIIVAEPVAPPRKVEPKTEKTTQERGQISVSAMPWGFVTIPGYVLRRESPIRAVKVKAGTHLIKVEHPPSGSKISRRVKVRGGRTVRCLARFTPEKTMSCQ